MKKGTVLFLLALTASIFLVGCKVKTPLDDPLVETPVERYAIDGLKKGVLPFSLEEIREFLIKLLLKYYGEVDSFIVIHKNELDCEWYGPGYNRHIRHKLCSVGKSVVSMLVGAMLEKEQLQSVDEKILDIYADTYPREQIQNYHSFKEAITIRTIMLMAGGFRWNEFRPAYFNPYGKTNPENDFVQLTQSADWVKYMLDLPMVMLPGIEFNYCTGGAILLEYALEKKTEMSLEDLLRENLFGPLGITSFAWQPAKTDNESNPFSGLAMHPADLAEFGRMVLYDGFLDGRRIVPAEWVREATARQITVNGLDTIDQSIDGYGYFWWKFSDEAVKDYVKINDIRLAWGYGGQLIVVCPHLETVIVSTGRNCDGFGKTVKLFREVIMIILKKYEYLKEQEEEN